MEHFMNYQTGMIVLGIICAGILFISILQSNVEWLINLLMRGVLGTVCIYFMNLALEKAGISLGVGINAVTILTSGILGIPGVVALYGLGIYTML